MKLTDNKKTAILIVMALLTALSYPLMLYFTIGKPIQEERNKIYNACIADGQKPYYCEALARGATNRPSVP